MLKPFPVYPEKLREKDGDVGNMLSTKMTEAFSLLMKYHRLIRGLSSGRSLHLTLEAFLSKDSGSELLRGHLRPNSSPRF